MFHPLSYQQARNFSFKCGLLYVAQPGYMLSRAGVPALAIIKKFAGKETKRVEDFISIFSKLTRGSRVPLEFVTHTDRHRSSRVLVTVDRHEWYEEPQLYNRDDATGLWKRTPAISSKFNRAYRKTRQRDSASLDRAKTKRRWWNDEDESG